MKLFRCILFSYLAIVCVALLCSCVRTGRSKVIVIQPMGNFSPALANSVYSQLRAVDSNIILRPAMPMPHSAYYAPRARYRADSIIAQLGRRMGGDTIVIGITDNDISTTKGKVLDWGVMGLGFCPGNACVVSTFRLSKNDLSSQFYKVAIHELGHTQGLPHCPNKTCFMRDAEGGNPVNEETGFCPSCKTVLVSKGWTLK